MKQLVLLFGFIGLCFQGFSQFDTNYVHLTRKHFAVYPLIESSNSKLYYDYLNANNDITEISYRTRRYNSIGFGASFYRLGFSVSFELPLTDIPELSKQTAFSFKGGYSYRKFYGEFKMRKFHGVEELILYPGDQVQIKDIRPDIKIKQYGGSLYYFTADKFNYDANFKNYNIQRKSAVSLYLNLGANYYDLKGDFLLTDTSKTMNSKFVTRFENFSMRLIPGFVFTLVYKKFYFAAMGGYGIAVNNNFVNQNNDKTNYQGVVAAFESNATLGYSSRFFFASIVFTFENDRVKYRKSNLGAIHTLWSLKVGKKLDIKYLGKLGKWL